MFFNVGRGLFQACSCTWMRLQYGRIDSGPMRWFYIWESWVAIRICVIWRIEWIWLMRIKHWMNQMMRIRIMRWMHAHLWRHAGCWSHEWQWQWHLRMTHNWGRCIGSEMMRRWRRRSRLRCLRTKHLAQWAGDQRRGRHWRRCHVRRLLAHERVAIPFGSCDRGRIQRRCRRVMGQMERTGPG